MKNQRDALSAATLALVFMGLLAGIRWSAAAGPDCHQREAEVEPNNLLEQARANGFFCIGDSYRSLPTDMWDMFAYDLITAGRISAVVTNLQRPEGRIALMLYTTQGVEVERDETPSDGLSISSSYLPPGHYIIAIYIEKPDANETAEYSLLVSNNDSFQDTILAYSEVVLDVSRNANRSQETNGGNLVTDAFLYVYETLGEVSGVDTLDENPAVAVQNGGGIRQNAGDFLTGEISRQNTLDVLPFLNDVIVIESMSPELLKEVMEFSVAGFLPSGAFLQVAGMHVVYDLGQPVGNRVMTLELMDDTDIVTSGIIAKDAPVVNFVTNNFTAAGGDGYDMLIDQPTIPLGDEVDKISYERALVLYLTESSKDFPIGDTGLPTIQEDDSRYQPEGERRIVFDALHLQYAPLTLFMPPPACFAGPDEDNPNNDASQANGPLCRGATIRGLPDDEFDYFMFDTSQPGRVAATVSNHLGEGVQLALYSGGCCSESQRVDFDSGQADGLEVTYTANQPGKFYIAIYSETPKPNETRPYTLQVEFP